METQNTLCPITLCRSHDTILCGGYTSGELKEIFGLKDIPPNTMPCVKSFQNGSVQTFQYPWDVIVQNKNIISENLKFRVSTDKNLVKYCDGVYIGKNVDIGKNVIFEASEESLVIIKDNVKIEPFTYIVGPVFIDEETIIKANSQIKDGVSIGRMCKIGGEIESSVISNYTNKQHYGYIGNSFIGEWVNMGAGTTNSDLKNTYGKIKIKYGDKTVDTGQQFLGCVICDYAKTAINTSIYTGKLIGVNAQIHGVVSSNIPSFVSYKRSIGLKNEEFYVDKAIEIQKKMFDRREIVQTNKKIESLRYAFGATQEKRSKFLNCEN